MQNQALKLSGNAPLSDELVDKNIDKLTHLLKTMLLISDSITIQQQIPQLLQYSYETV